jgi:hypothetical protein
MSISKLENSGIRYIGNEELMNAEEKTLIVVGIARGGTSLIAGTFHHLGVFTGDKSVSPVFEDTRLANEFETKNIEKANSIIEEYNTKEKMWLFKRPQAINYLNEINKSVRNPIYLFIFKDIFAVSNRNSISMKTDVTTGLKKAHDDYLKIIQFIEEYTLNALLLSYEKIMLNKTSFVDSMIQLIGEDKVSNEQRESALDFIEPNPKEYIDKSRITKTAGRIGKIEKTKIIGWAKYVYTDKIAEVELYINDVLIKTTIAKDFRQNVLDAKQHKTGYCGYFFDLSDMPLNNLDKVSVKVTDDVLFLNGSDTVFHDEDTKRPRRGSDSI